ncbi:ABC transporter ATP-binding protein [Paraburkholderia unamae]|uniref:ABC transporter ATP-binding protein n=1 Tax=Paraburkholderia unamae TaxID=219649 RepID=UPI000DC384EE|nr:ABC transporter ATP-binding protein [Paraburkholderia unamae]RAR65964.1 amino acid/amide ABC transporter ATP-binding protein 1 (HAAT family) [Paraburkholderia unamae]CAG9266702.1 ABC transporter ATP-binding protein [Paraburkholderia unamae]
MSSDNILEARGLSKEFRGFHAVKDVDLNIKRHSIHALIGPNGAGKTTCFNLLTTFLRPTTGVIRFNGRSIEKSNPAQVSNMGLVRSFQISAVFGTMTVLENVRIALQQRKTRWSYQFWRSQHVLRALDERARELIDLVELTPWLDVKAANLSYGRKRALELVTTIALDPELILLDEPMAGLGHEDIEPVTQLIQRVAQGRTILMVEHNMKVIAQLCDRVTVLQSGEILAEGTYDEVSTNPAVVEAYVGGADE